MTSNRAANAYAKVGLESNVAGASPHDLIIMLYQASIASIAKARTQIAAKDIPGKGASISRAISLIGSGLQASLNLEEGGQIAENLYDLYGYMIQRLTAANIGNDVAILAEVESLLGDLLGAWEGIKPQQQNAFVPQQPSEHAGAGYGRL